MRSVRFSLVSVVGLSGAFFSIPKTESEQSWVSQWQTLVGSCFIYESQWFSPACLPALVIHEWTRQLEPAIVKVQSVGAVDIED